MIVARLWQGLIVMFLLSVICFWLFEVSPGDAISDLSLDPGVTSHTLEQVRAQRGLAGSPISRYFLWLQSAVAGDWGVSASYQRPVSEILLPRAGRTFGLNASALSAAWLLAVPLAYFRVRRPSAVPGLAATGAIHALVATPDLLVALAGLWLAMHTGWFTVSGSFTLSLFCLLLLLMPPVFRHAEAAFREAIQQPFVLNATAAGLHGWRFAVYWVFPAAAGPLLALLGLQLSACLSASLIVEVVLGWPGLGPLLLEAVLGRDHPVIAASVLLSGAALLAGNLAADLLQRALQPRSRRAG